MERLKETDAITEAIREFGKVRLPAWCVRSSVCARPHLALAGMPLLRVWQGAVAGARSAAQAACTSRKHGLTQPGCSRHHG